METLGLQVIQDFQPYHYTPDESLVVTDPSQARAARSNARRGRRLRNLLE